MHLFVCICYVQLLFVTEMLCAGKRSTEVKSAWTAVWIILIGIGMAAGGGYLVYKHRLRVSFVLDQF